MGKMKFSFVEIDFLETLFFITIYLRKQKRRLANQIHKASIFIFLKKDFNPLLPPILIQSIFFPNPY